MSQINVTQQVLWWLCGWDSSRKMKREMNMTWTSAFFYRSAWYLHNH